MKAIALAYGLILGALIVGRVWWAVAVWVAFPFLVLPLIGLVVFLVVTRQGRAL